MLWWFTSNYCFNSTSAILLEMLGKHDTWVFLLCVQTQRNTVTVGNKTVVLSKAYESKCVSHGRKSEVVGMCVCGLLVADKCWRFEESQQKRKACLQYTSLMTRLEPQQIFTRLRGSVDDCRCSRRKRRRSTIRTADEGFQWILLNNKTRSPTGRFIVVPWPF